MPFKMDEGERQNLDYCSYCQQDGKFKFEGTRKEFQQLCYSSMRKSGMGVLKAKIFTWMIRFAPQWK
jgi:hypothetical protein